MPETWGRYIVVATAIVTAAIAILMGVIDLCQGLVCLLQNTVLCGLTNVASGNIVGTGECLAAANPCWADMGAAVVKIAAGLGIGSPGLQRLKSGPFSRTDEPPTQDKP